jgi:hypothetical protein
VKKDRDHEIQENEIPNAFDKNMRNGVNMFENKRMMKASSFLLVYSPRSNWKTATMAVISRADGVDLEDTDNKCFI